MIKNITEELVVDTESGGVIILDQPDRCAARRFQFDLCQKRTVLGDVNIDQFWMHQHGLYGERNQESRNRRAIIDYFWALCMRHGTILEQAVRESYLLAELLPYARSNGSRRVFADATLTRPEHMGERNEEVVAELERLLQASRDKELSKIAFRDHTANLLGPPEYEPQVWERYGQFCRELFEDASQALLRADREAVSIVVGRWAEKMRTIGRRGGHELEKEVLDIMSYECRAALHRAYSAVWCGLLPHLADKYEISGESLAFHRFWHLDQCEESNQPDEAYFHLFHGHIFALHPACGAFMLTRTGPELVGEWLKDLESETTFPRLLHGLFVAMHHYAGRNQVYAFLRKKESKPDTVSDMVAFEEQLTEQRSGRRRHRRRKTDAR